MSTFPLLETDQYILRQFVADDQENVFHGLSHPEVIKYYGINFKTLEATKEQMIWFEELWKTETGIWWAISSKEDNRFLGAIGFNDRSKEHRKAELGFWLLPDYWRKGIISKVAPLAIDYGFENLNLHRIEAFVETENIASKQLLNRLGFKLEGTMVDCEIKNESFISVDVYAKLR